MIFKKKTQIRAKNYKYSKLKHTNQIFFAFSIIFSYWVIFVTILCSFWYKIITKLRFVLICFLNNHFLTNKDRDVLFVAF